VTTSAEEAYCREASEVAAGAVPVAALDLGSVRPPLPAGIEAPRGLVLEPQPLPRDPVAPEAPRLTVPDMDRRKVVIIGTTDVEAAEMRRRFEKELQQLGLRASANAGETKANGELTGLTFSYGGRNVQGDVDVDRCGRSSQVVVTQTLVP